MGNFLMPIQPRQQRVSTMPIDPRMPRDPAGLMPIQQRTAKPGGNNMLMPIQQRIAKQLTPKQQRQLLLAAPPTQPTPLLDALNQRSTL